MYSIHPPWFHLFKTLDHKWEYRSFSITDSARNGENILSSGAWGIKSPSGLLRKLMKMNVIIPLCSPSALLPQLHVGFVWKILISSSHRPSSSFSATECTLSLFQERNMFCACPHNCRNSVYVMYQPRSQIKLWKCNIYICIVFYKKIGPHTAFHQHRKSIKSIAHCKKWVRNRECEQVLNNSQAGSPWRKWWYSNQLKL